MKILNKELYQKKSHVKKFHQGVKNIFNFIICTFFSDFFSSTLDCSPSQILIDWLNLKLKSEEKEAMAAQKLSLLEKLYAEKEFVDVKILCDEKTFECHKNVLSCQSEVFKTMIINKSLNEKKTGIMEIEENDISSDIMEELLYYLYHDKVDDTKKINLDLLVAADKYMVSGLLGECVEYFKSNLSDQNALDVLFTAEITNQKDLFEAVSRFVGKKKPWKFEQEQELSRNSKVQSNNVYQGFFQNEGCTKRTRKCGQR